MGRKRKQKDLEEAIAEKTVNGLGHNKPELTEDEKRALLFQHKKAYETALATKKKADADFKNACKSAKAECGKDAVKDIKDAIALDSPEGEAAHRAEIERQLRIARWMGAAVGTQFTFDESDRTPGTERAYEAGKRVGLAGEPCNPPHDPSTPQYGSWMEGFHAGQEVLGSGFKSKLAADPVPEIVDEDPIGANA